MRKNDKILINDSLLHEQMFEEAVLLILNLQEDHLILSHNFMLIIHKISTFLEEYGTHPARLLCKPEKCYSMNPIKRCITALLL